LPDGSFEDWKLAELKTFDWSLVMEEYTSFGGIGNLYLFWSFLPWKLQINM
jgi:hypothetical protein